MGNCHSRRRKALGEVALNTQVSYGKSRERLSSLVIVALSHVLFYLSQLWGLAGAAGLGDRKDGSGRLGAWECGTWRVEEEVLCRGGKKRGCRVTLGAKIIVS